MRRFKFLNIVKTTSISEGKQVSKLYKQTTCARNYNYTLVVRRLP